MRNRKVVAVFIVVFGIGITSVTFYGYQVINAPNILVEKDDATLLIPLNATFKSVQDSLFDKGYVHDLVAFSFLAKLMDYDKTVKPGRYRLRRNMSNITAIRMLRAGEQEPVNVTFNSIRKLEELPEKVCQNLAISPQEFSSALSDHVAHNEWGFDERTAMAMFIPNTYQFYWNVSGEQVIKRLYDEYEKFWNENRMSRADALGLTPIEVYTLASIVQAEQMNYAEERPTIAGLYINRLKKGMKLDSDPTLVFAVGDFTLRRVLNIHKEVDSPYNTYKNAGLPPGPINMPDVSSIDAVLNYEKHNYLYMVAKEDFSGYHRFATNLRDHINNANRYQRQLTIEQRKARLRRTN